MNGQGPYAECHYGETLLHVRNVNVAYDNVPVLRDLDFEVKNLIRPGFHQGQVVGFLGPSGVGKSTTFRVLAGLEEPDSGEVLVEVEQKPVHRGMVGVVTQDYKLFAHRTVQSNLLIAAKQAHLKDGTQRVNELLERFGLREHASKYPSQLSGGQRQRVAIAQQLLCSDHFLLMDEPFSGLDLVAQDAVIRLIAELAQSDELKTFIIVTHDVRAALEVCDTIMLLGRDRDASGAIIPGARVQQTFNLVERGLTWRENVSQTPEFFSVMREIEAAFPKL